MDTWLPALLAIGAAALIAVGTVLRQRASMRSGAAAMWWTGAMVAICGFTLQATALGLGSILLVQPLVVLAVLFALPMEAYFDHRRSTRREWMWGGVLVGSVGLFLCAASPHDVARRPDHLLIVVTIGGLIALLVGLVFAAERADRHNRALYYGLVAGALFGISALLVKTVVDVSLNDPLALAMRPELYLFVLVAGGGVIAQQRSFVSGELQTSFPAMTVMEPAVSMVLGVSLLGESVEVGWWQTPVMIIALVGMVYAVVILARQSALRNEPWASDAGSADAVDARGSRNTVDSATQSPPPA
ncbi:DMT family transporter [Williamsia sp. CHRR-6]|uniref:DMT family transporter n=1 Tax=Williamsia sp. CHRR-6 TaxID=2835871 RepID=UPI001BDB41D8|nr:DMT family transporter [Williamsia sp. CHRR-6]MBT0565843.1 DMT family transporter [Williamsia sp. CHRR-6]